MKLKYFVLGATASLALSSCGGVFVSQQPARSESQAVVKSGTFLAAEHPTQGTARIVIDNGKRYVELDSAFKSDEGPDLKVILYRSGMVPIGNLQEQDYVVLAPLKQTSGAQRYEIPDSVNLAKYRSLAIWCQQFNATFGYAALGFGRTSIAESSPGGSRLVASTAPASQQVALKSGTFVAAEHPTKGTARIMMENGKKYIEFDESFKSDEGPDLKVILHRSDSVPVSGVKEQDYVLIAPLKQTSGAQRYEIPDNVNLSNYRSVAIWCQQFNATFGYAPLKSTATAAS